MHAIMQPLGLNFMHLVYEDPRWESMARIGFSKYQAHPDGLIRVAKSKRMLKQNLNNMGYYRITLVGDDTKKHPAETHTFIAKMFVPNPQDKPTVDHLDRNRANNKVNNLA